MDPQSANFTPRDEFWRFQSDMLRVQQTQADHADRLSRLERRQEDDARMKSVWGSSSPFPGVLSGTPQQAPLQQPPADAFSGFDDHSLIGSLHLDADEEPRRTGATSRANSVRFDESANQSHWSHPHRTSIDLIPRSGSSLSNHAPAIERTFSHKSDGRQSSAGHSVTSGRANSLGIDTPFSGLGTSPAETPGFAPGLLMLGSVPSIIRCWLNDDFKHASLLYAAVCTGSHGSYLDERLVSQLGFADRVSGDYDRKIKLLVYFPEAMTRGSASSRPSSPSPQLPSITIDFSVINQSAQDEDKSIQIFIGSDVLRAHNGDVMFSTNSINMYDDDRCKLSIPMVRPENDQTFKSLRITSSPILPPTPPRKLPPILPPSPLNGLKQTVTNESLPQSSLGSPMQQPSPRISLDEKRPRPSLGDGESSAGSGRPSLEGRPLGLTGLNTSSTSDTKSADTSSSANAPRSASSSSAIWGTWRRGDDAKPASAITPSDSWAKAGTNYQRREQGIKVLRPSKPASSRTFSANNAGASGTSPAATTGMGMAQATSRFFPSADGSRRTSLEAAGEANKPSTAAAGGIGAKKTSSNPIGGASAFSWMANK